MKTPRRRHKILALVLAGGEGKRLRPLTSNRCKPAVPFGGRYRVVDFVLSNLINSEIRSIYLLVQYKAQSLIEHVRKAWTISPLLPDQFVSVVPPQMQQSRAWFAGTADAVHQSRSLIQLHRPDLVAVFGADHIYRMDVRQMVRFHLERDADVTLAALPVPIESATRYGVIGADADGRIQSFDEKPEAPAPMPSDPTRAFASMGNYLFDAQVLLDSVDQASHPDEPDFGGHVIPRLLAERRLYAYDFSTNQIPGAKPYEEPAYWRDVGSLDAYFEAHQELLGSRPRFDAFNPQWPIYSSHYQGPVTRIMRSEVDNSLLGSAAVIENARLSNSIICREVVVEPTAEVTDCIIMDYSRIGRGARLRRVIVDRHNDIPPGTRIGFDLEADAAQYQVTPGGVVVIPKGDPGYSARGGRGSSFGYAE